MAINEQIFQQRQQLEHAVAQALDIATKHQATAEVSISKSTGLSVSARLGEVENIEFNNDGALGIAVYKGQHKGSASTTDLSEQAIIKTVQAALDIAHYTSEDPFTGLADQALMAYEVTDLDLYHPPVINTEQAIESVIRAEHSALQQDKRIVNSDGASFSGHQGVKVYGNTHGMLQSYCLSRYSLSCCVVAQENEQMERDYAYTLARDYHALIDDKAVGLESADKVLARLGTRSLPTMTVPVLFAADVAASLFGHLVAAISGGNLFRKTSFLLDSLGQKIFPEQVSIFEDPWIKKGLASSPFDSEGVKTQPKMIVDQGVIQTYLLSSYSARKLSMTTTGHAGGIHNWLVQGKGGDFEQMLKTLGTGLLVTELMGQGVNIMNGDYSRGACGFWVENGQIQYPVSEITIAGDLPNMFRQIVVIGNDVEKRGSIQTGSVLVESMRIAGQ